MTSITVVGDAQSRGEDYRGGRVAYDPRYDRDPRYNRGYGRRVPYAQVEIYGRYFR